MTDQTTRPIVPLENPDEVLHRRQLADRVNSAFPKDGSEGMVAPAKLMSYAAADLPAAAQWTGAMVYVSDEGAIAVSDGTSWIRADVSLASDEVITGRWKFTGAAVAGASSLSVENANPQFTIYDTSNATVDNKAWNFYANSGSFHFRLLSDDYNTAVTMFRLERIGMAPATAYVTGNLVVSANIFSNLYTNVGGLLVVRGGYFRVRDSGGTDYVNFTHDGTDFNLAGVNTTDINITGVTAVNVPALESSGPIKLASYTVAGVPAAASNTGAMIYVSNETGGAIPAFSDGTNWRRVSDRAVIA